MLQPVGVKALSVTMIHTQNILTQCVQEEKEAVPPNFVVLQKLVKTKVFAVAPNKDSLKLLNLTKLHVPHVLITVKNVVTPLHQLVHLQVLDVDLDGIEEKMLTMLNAPLVLWMTKNVANHEHVAQMSLMKLSHVLILTMLFHPAPNVTSVKPLNVVNQRFLKPLVNLNELDVDLVTDQSWQIN
jgi:hypothetical protein